MFSGMKGEVLLLSVCVTITKLVTRNFLYGRKAVCSYPSMY